MMNRYRRLFAGLLLLTMLAAAGCGRSGTNGQMDGVPRESIAIQGSGTAKAKTLTEVVAQATSQPGIFCEYVVRPDQGSVLKGKLWIAADNLRSESIEAGQSTAIFIRNSKKGYNYIFTSGDKQAIKVTDTHPAEEINPVEILRVVSDKTQPLGKEVKDGKNCIVIKYEDDAVVNQVWIWEDYGVPVRIESTYNKSTTVMEYGNYKFEPIAEAMFELPEGMTVMELPAIGSGMP